MNFAGHLIWESDTISDTRVNGKMFLSKRSKQRDKIEHLPIFNSLGRDREILCFIFLRTNYEFGPKLAALKCTFECFVHVCMVNIWNHEK